VVAIQHCCVWSGVFGRCDLVALVQPHLTFLFVCLLREIEMGDEQGAPREMHGPMAASAAAECQGVWGTGLGGYEEGLE